MHYTSLAGAVRIAGLLSILLVFVNIEINSAHSDVEFLLQRVFAGIALSRRRGATGAKNAFSIATFIVVSQF